MSNSSKIIKTTNSNNSGGNSDYIRHISSRHDTFTTKSDSNVSISSKNVNSSSISYTSNKPQNSNKGMKRKNLERLVDLLDHQLN